MMVQSHRSLPSAKRERLKVQVTHGEEEEEQESKLSDDLWKSNVGVDGAGFEIWGISIDKTKV